MRVACELCAEITEATLRIDGSAVAITCAACGGTFTAAAAATTSAADVGLRDAKQLDAERLDAERLDAERLDAERLDAKQLDAEQLEAARADGVRAAGMMGGGAAVCPKCETRWDGEGPCRRCGLAPEHARAWRERDAAPPTATMGAAWEAVRAAWEDEVAHERAAAIAIEGGELAWLAARYRGHLRRLPEDVAARRQLARLARRAEATLRATASVPGPARAPGRVPYAVVIAIALVIGTGLLYALHVIRERREAESSGRVRPVERVAPPAMRR